MRMWMVDPRIMCQQHLLGEHVELHMFVGHFNLGRKMGKYAPMCEPHRIEERHEQLVAEMAARGMNHRSVLAFSYKGKEDGKVDPEASLVELMRRCPSCRDRWFMVHGVAWKKIGKKEVAKAVSSS